MLLCAAVLLFASWGGFLKAPSVTLALVPAFFLGLGTLLLHNTLQVHATQMAPQARGTAMALFATALFISQSLAIAMGGWVVDRYGTSAIFAVACLGGPLTALFFWRRLAARAAQP